MYVMITGGSSSWVMQEKADALLECKLHVRQYISDFLSHQLPLKVTPEIQRRFDVVLLHYVRPDEASGLPGSSASEVELPYQAWVDEYYEEDRKEAARRARLIERTVQIKNYMRSGLSLAREGKLEAALTDLRAAAQLHLDED